MKFRFSYPLKLLLTAIPLSVFAVPATAPIHTRVALVIGNSAYLNAPLVNPVNDAKAMSQTLRDLGFEVIEVRNATTTEMKKAIGKASDALKGKEGVGLLYYAGHGLQVDQHNYIIPVDAKLAKVSDVAQQTLDISTVVDAFKSAGNRMNIIVLDACRNNPFGKTASGQGLAPMDAPTGTFLAYATAPGNVAEDGDEKSANGLYTSYLLEELRKPHARIEDIFKRVRFNVRQKSEGRQIPWESTSLEEDFSFSDGAATKFTKTDPVVLVASFNEEKLEWDKIKESKKAGDFYAFIQKYPNGVITEAAHSRINQLDKTNLLVQGASAEGKPEPYSVRKFRVGDEYRVVRSSTVNGNEQPQANDKYKVAKIEGDEITVEADIDIGAGKSSRTNRFFTLEGGHTGNTYARYDPPQFHAPVGLLQVGRKWRISYQATSTIASANNSTIPVTGEGKIVAKERVVVPAGAFDTFKVDYHISLQNGGLLSETSCFVWLGDDLPEPVKTECTVKMSGASNLNLITTTKLEQFVRGK